MRYLILISILFSALFLSGCGEEYIAGVTTGATIMNLANQAQDELVGVTGQVIARRDELQAELDAGFAAWAMVGREKDPMTWIAIAEAFGLTTWLGMALKKRMG
jgi:hypothetical protein